jgi:hypothetical protein
MKCLIVRRTNVGYIPPMPVAPPIKVRIRNEVGLYLTGDPSQWSFSADRSKAIVFDYVRHQIGEQLEAIRHVRGVALEAEPVEPEEVYEICERCHKFATAFTMFFDGTRFLCFDCLTESAGRCVSVLSAQLPKAQAFTTTPPS